jgi:thymidine phosphorylase
VTLAREMLEASGASGLKDPAIALTDGSAMDVWRAMISAQGGDLSVALPMARETHDVIAETSGYLTKLDALAVGMASWRLGAGRARKEDSVQFGAGIQWHVGHGEQVTKGQKIFTLHTDEPARFELALEVLTPGYEIGSESQISQRLPLIIERVV